MNIFDLVLGVFGIYQIVFSFVARTKNTASAIVFQIVPFFSGLFSLVYILLKYIGIL